MAGRDQATARAAATSVAASASHSAIAGSASTLATQADQMPRHWMARIVAVLWMFTGVVFVAFYTAQLTASLTAQQIRGAINGPEDLVGRTVGTTHGSTAAAYLNETKAQLREFESVDELYDALLNKQVDAVVFDAPSLFYYASHEGKGHARVDVIVVVSAPADEFERTYSMSSTPLIACSSGAATVAATTSALAPG